MRRAPTLLAAAVLLATLAPACALAQVESTPIPAPNKPNFSPASFLLGTWTCRTKSARRPAAYVTTSTYALDPTGYWITETSVTQPTAWISRQLSVWDRISYDTQAKRWVDLSYGDGGSYGLSFSKGWNGSQIVWHDVTFAPTNDISGQTDTTWTKIGATKMMQTSSFTEAKSGRHVSVTATCIKS